MNKRCVNCPNTFELNTKNRNRKYCDVCKIIILKEQKKKNDLSRYHTTRREYDLFCTKCFASLPTGSHQDKMYCEKCLKIHTKQRVAAHIRNKRNRIKLDKFYKNLRINLIQSPYLIDIKTLNKIILLENK